MAHFQLLAGRVCAAAFVGVLLISRTVVAQQQQTPKPDDPPPSAITPGTLAPSPTTETQDKRIFGVLPNYRTAETEAASQPLTTWQKFIIAAKDSFDWPIYFVSGGFAALYQLENQNPSFGQGLKGYAHRYVTSYGDQTIGNMMTEAILPALLREDPRYFRKAHGGTWSRMGYAASRIVITRTDAGGTMFNFSEVLGNGITAAVGSAYYPQARDFDDTMQRWYTQLLTDAFSQELKEFWPDIKRHMKHRNNGVNASDSNGGH